MIKNGGTIKEFGEKIRTERQNKSLHKYLEMVAHELQNQGQTMDKVVQKLNFVEITPTKNSVKEIIFRPIMEAVVGKNTSRNLTTKEIQECYEIMSMFLSKQFQISLSWPSEEDTPNYQHSLEQSWHYKDNITRIEQLRDIVSDDGFN